MPAERQSTVPAERQSTLPAERQSTVPAERQRHPAGGAAEHRAGGAAEHRAGRAAEHRAAERRGEDVTANGGSDGLEQLAGMPTGGAIVLVGAEHAHQLADDGVTLERRDRGHGR